MLIEIKKFLKKKNTREIKENDIDLAKLNEMEKQGATIVDVRSPQEYEEGHLQGAILLPEYEIKKKAKEILTDTQNVIIVYCRSGIRSKRAQKELQQMGFKEVYNLENGLENYWDFKESVLE